MLKTTYEVISSHVHEAGLSFTNAVVLFGREHLSGRNVEMYEHMQYEKSEDDVCGYENSFHDIYLHSIRLNLQK